MSRTVKIAIIGAGNRGQAFAKLLAGRSDAEVVAVADPRDCQRKQVAGIARIPESGEFRDWSEITARPERIADAAIIAVQDGAHCEAACAFAARGYQLLLEKPMAPTWEECRRIVKTARDSQVGLTICHELRYTSYFRTIRSLIEAGAIGEIQTVQHFEAVGYWHQAHSYVRGNWRNEKFASFMLLAKSCHDIDIMSFLIGRPCLKVNSFGQLSHFRRECAPPGSSERCLDCPAAIEASCPYSARKIYLRDRAALGDFDWPVNIITDDLTLAGVERALREGPYGRCVYRCDNNVVDHQVVNLEFEGGTTASFTMTAFTRQGGRRETRICGTDGELVGDGETIRVYRFLDDSCRVVETARNSTGDISDGHGGGDGGIVSAWVRSLNGSDPKAIVTGPEATLESHRIVFAAETSRRTGRVVELKDCEDFTL